MPFSIKFYGGVLVMMGQHTRSESLFYYFRIPEDHLLRLVDQHIDFRIAPIREVSPQIWSDGSAISIDTIGDGEPSAARILAQGRTCSTSRIRRTGYNRLSLRRVTSLWGGSGRWAWQPSVVLPVAKNVPGSAKNWSAIDHDGSWDDKPRWSPERANPNGRSARRLRCGCGTRQSSVWCG